MSEKFLFEADGTSKVFHGPADIFVGASEDLGGGTLTVMIDGGKSDVTGPTLAVDSETKIESRCNFTLVLSGATSPDVGGLVVPWVLKTA